MRIGKLRAGRESLILLSLALGTALIWYQALTPHQASLHATFLDVGQGDCIFIRTPSGRTMLVDGGGIPGSEEDTIGLRVVEPFLRRQGVNCLDVVVLTHPHDDHLLGLIPVLRHFRVRMVLCPASPQWSDSYSQFLSLLKERRIPHRRAERGQVIDFGDGTSAQVLNPPAMSFGETEDEANDSSVVLRVVYGNDALMLAGDAGQSAEEQMLKWGPDLRSDVLKIAHHGSEDATSDAWLDAVDPDVAVISVGRNNSFGHPSKEVLRRLSAHRIAVRRTDVEGAVSIDLGSP